MSNATTATPAATSASPKPFGKNTKQVTVKGLVLYSQFVQKGSKWSEALDRALTIPRSLNKGLKVEEHFPYLVFKDVTFLYNNELIQVEVHTDKFGRDVYSLTLSGRYIVGYFEFAS